MATGSVRVRSIRPCTRWRLRDRWLPAARSRADRGDLIPSPNRVAVRRRRGWSNCGNWPTRCSERGLGERDRAQRGVGRSGEGAALDDCSGMGSFRSHRVRGATDSYRVVSAHVRRRERMVVLTTVVVGYAAKGSRGELFATLVAFTPSFLFVLFRAPRFGRIRANRTIQSFLTGAGAAVIGASRIGPYRWVSPFDIFGRSRCSPLHWFGSSPSVAAS